MATNKAFTGVNTVFAQICRSPWFFYGNCSPINRKVVGTHFPVFFLLQIVLCVSAYQLLTLIETESANIILFPSSVPNSLAVARQSKSSNGKIHTVKRGRLPRKGMDQKQLGVYTLRIDDASSKSNEDRELLGIKQVCLHNARICGILAEMEKAEIWELLAQIVGSR
jgi:hypothetical protein